MSIELVLCLWIVGLGMLLAELFVPGMIVGAIGAALVLVSIVAMFVIEDGGPGWGGGLALVSLVLGAVFAKLAAARLTHSHSLSSEQGFSGTDDRSSLLGREGITATTLRPGGFATIDGERVDVVTGGEMIAEGIAVVVTRVEGNRIQVRAKG